MPLLRRLALLSLSLFAAACSSSSAGGGGGADAAASDATADTKQSGPDSEIDGTTSGNDGSATDGASNDSSSGGGDAPYDAGPPGDATSCTTGFSLCNGHCVDEGNDIHNCGGCAVTCQDTNPYCDFGHCTTAPCDGGQCGGGTFCCGTECCTAGQLCCDVPSNIPTVPKCTDPVNGTCPMGCPVCP